MNTQIEKVIYKDGETNLQSIVYKDTQGVERVGYVDSTVIDYIAEHPGTVCITFNEAMRRMDEAQEKVYIKPWTEISEEAWTEALEVLPPQKWQTVDGVELFRMSEYTTGNITTHYARIAGRCFCANRRTSDAYKNLAAEVKAVTVLG